MKYRLLKFDVIHPKEYLQEKKSEWKDLESLTLDEYRKRLISLRSNYSDFYTYYLNQAGWEAEEFFLLDKDFLRKAAKTIYGRDYKKEMLKTGIKNKIRPESHRWRNRVVGDYIRQFKPDVIFARSQPLPSNFWQTFRESSLIVGRLSARLPSQWHPNHFDLLYTDHPVFKQLFEMHDVKTILNKQGFDQRINEDLKKREKQFDLTFVGGMGTENFLKRTEFFNRIAMKREDFRWWGYWWRYGSDGRKFSDFPALESSFQGYTSGLDMYQVFSDTKINLNDYVDTAQGIGYNQRMFEVMGTGAFLLTREATNLKKDFPENIFVTFTDLEDCLDKIRYFLKNEREREEIAENAKKYIREHFNFQKISEQFGRDLIEILEKGQ